MKTAIPPRLYRRLDTQSTAVDVVRLGAAMSMVGGVMWVISGILGGLLAGGVLSGIPGMETANEAGYILAMVGTLGGIVALHARQTPGYGWCGRLGFLAASGGSVILVAGLTLSSLIGAYATMALDSALIVGFWGVACGLPLLGVATIRLGFLPQWCGALLVVSLPVAVVMGDYGGGIAFGALWIALGRNLLCLHDVSAMIKASNRGRA